MNLSTHNPALLRGILAGALVLSGASACSRHDRAGAGRDTTESAATAVTPSDSQISPTAPQPSSGAATQPSGDTARVTAHARTRQQRTPPSSKRASQDTTVRSGEAAVSGYRGMERDSSTQPDTLAASDNTADSVGVSSNTASAEMAGTGAATPLDSAGVTSDYALTTDMTTAGYSEMARDTSSGAGRGDTAAVAVADTTTPAESDTATLTVASVDSADSASAKDRAEPTSREVPTDAAGAGPIGNAVTGIDAVSLMSRAGARCVVKDDSSDVWWDMADSPAALNPCGTGTMTLSPVRTGERH